MSWDPAQYARYADARARPALDLIARLPESPAPRRIVDLGCGDGRITRLLALRWPEAEITGVDSDAAMLAAAAAEPATIDWIRADIADWQPHTPVDLIFSNAALHWLPDHPRLFSHLLRQLTPGGRLAVQMPDNFAVPSHRLPRALAASAEWATRVGDAGESSAVLAPAQYYDICQAAGAEPDLWTTEYLQIMAGVDPVLNWIRGSLLVPVLQRLGQDAPAFLDALRPELAAAYPAQPDGRTLFPFRRLFIIARVTG